MKDKTPPYLSWNRKGYAEFRTLQELEQLIEQLTVQAYEQNQLIGVEVCVDDDSCLLITVGREETHMEFYSTAGKPLVVVCRGPWDNDELITYNHGGQWSEMEKRYCVPSMEARVALRIYFETGLRPNNITWG